MDSNDSGYTHVNNNHSIGNFGMGVQSSALIEGLWNIIKSKIKSTFHIIPQKNVLHFIREEEYKYIILSKNYDEKIGDFLACYQYILDVSDVNIQDTEFFRDNEIYEDEQD